jgi:putative peptidoglycan lipid II flippase
VSELEEADSRSRLLSAGAFMAAGTVLSRVTGFLRSALIVVALGLSLDADLFTGANTLPNSLYILIAGGVFNVVLVPQLVRALKDPDGGVAYANRLLTLGVVVLAGATLLLVAAVPLIARLAYPADLFTPALDEARQSAVLLMYLCMPQVFFYGVFVLVGQLLNSRRRFGPMMWAPIANNLVACASLGIYLALYGSTEGSDGYTRGQELLLGLGATAGIVVQTLILLPYLRALGFRVRPRFDFRGVGLGHTLRLGAWTVGFVLASQVAFFVILRIATSASTTAALEGGQAAGSTAYQSAFLVTQVPHAVITVSLVTASMPLLSSLAADGRAGDLRAELVDTLRLIAAALVPVAVALACLAGPLAAAMFGYGEQAGETGAIADTLSAFAPGLVLFTVHYLMLRGFYATEDTRTPFFVQVGLASVNVGAGIALTRGVEPSEVSTRLALAYAIAYAVGAAASSTLLSRRVGPLFGRAFASYAARLAAACAVAAAVMLSARLALAAVGVDGERPASAVAVLALAGSLGAGAYVLAARLANLQEVTAITGALLRRRSS